MSPKSMKLIILWQCFAVSAIAEPLGTTVTIAPGVQMPTVVLGTCCGSKPQVGLAPWLKAGGVGIDTAWNYHTQTDIGMILKEQKISRASVFIETKIPGGDSPNATDCSGDPGVVLWYVKENLRMLGVDYVDLLLLHRGCEQTNNGKPSPFLTPAQGRKANAVLWESMRQVLALNLTRAIGVSNYNASQLGALPSPKPAVNQCNMGVNSHDDATIAYCKENGIQYQAYRAMHNCPFTDSRITSIASSHSVSAAQVCLRYVLDKGVAIAVGTGKDPEKVAKEAAENLDVYGFHLSKDEFNTVDAIGRLSHDRVVV